MDKENEADNLSSLKKKLEKAEQKLYYVKSVAKFQPRRIFEVLENLTTSENKDFSLRLSQYAESIIHDINGPLNPEAFFVFLKNDIFDDSQKDKLTTIRKYSNDIKGSLQQISDFCGTLQKRCAYRLKQNDLDSTIIEKTEKFIETAKEENKLKISYRRSSYNSQNTKRDLFQHPMSTRKRKGIVELTSKINKCINSPGNLRDSSHQTQSTKVDSEVYHENTEPMLDGDVNRSRNEFMPHGDFKGPNSPHTDPMSIADSDGSSSQHTELMSIDGSDIPSSQNTEIMSTHTSDESVESMSLEDTLLPFDEEYSKNFNIKEQTVVERHFCLRGKPFRLN